MDKRNYMIVKSNDIIQNVRFTLNCQEQKVLLYIISKIKPNDCEFKESKFNMKEYCEILGITYNSGQNYDIVQKTLKNLRDKSIWIKTNKNTKGILLSWIDTVEINYLDGSITVKLSKSIQPYLLQLAEQFTQYSFIYVLPMESKYSIRLYEWFKSYAFQRDKTIDISSIKDMLMVENYKNFGDFKRKILDIAINEINEHTDLFVSYEILKNGRAYEKIKFNIKKLESFESLKKRLKINELLRSGD